VKETLAIYNDSKDLIDIGAYTKGSNIKIDYALNNIDKIGNYLRQQIEEKAFFDDTISSLEGLLS
jgi:flagellum-specific ATP synthase